MIPWPRWRSNQTGQRRMQHLHASTIPADVNCQVRKTLSEDSSSQQVEWPEGKNSLQSLCVYCVILQGAAAALRDHTSPLWHWADLTHLSCLWKLWKSCCDIFKLNRVISLYTTSYEMLIVKFSFSVLESISLFQTEAGGGDSTFLQSPKHSRIWIFTCLQHVWMSGALSIQLSEECGNVSELNLPAFICSTLFWSCLPWPTAFLLSLRGHDISHVMSETVVRVLPVSQTETKCEWIRGQTPESWTWAACSPVPCDSLTDVTATHTY